MIMPRVLILLAILALSQAVLNGEEVNGPAFEIKLTEEQGVQRVEYYSGSERIAAAPASSPLGIRLKFPDAAPVTIPAKLISADHSEWRFAPFQHGGLTFTVTFVRRTPALIERKVDVKADQDGQFTIDFDFTPTVEGEYGSFLRSETERIIYDTQGGGPEYPDVPGQTFPVGLFHKGKEVFGVIADSPGRWENRCQIEIDPPGKLLSVNTGDGSAPRDLTIKYDARDQYNCRFDGWQRLKAGETRGYSTWLFASPAETQFQSQLAAHLALANAKGWNSSSVEAILRNTSYLLLRRNLMRDEGKYIFVSGIGYGWKQWVSDGFYTALGLNDPETTIEACRSVFSNRMTYEENAQYYLIWSALLKRAGGELNDGLVREAFDFIRKNERNGVYVPPPLKGAPSAQGWKTYMDLLEYDNDDAPTSNQGFHCGALLAAMELGLPVTETDVQRAIDGYRGMFNTQAGFMPTSLKKQEILGQDSLYGATLTNAVFGRKLLTDEQVLAHHRHSMKTRSPYGLRVISQADGALLPNHNGSYVHGGSWFLCDAANYQLAGVHGLPADEVDRLLIERIQLEIAHVPAFNESISTVTGQPHGHILYSWNSGYWWIRRQIRKHQGLTGPDPVEQAIDAQLHVIRDEHGLSLRLPTP